MNLRNVAAVVGCLALSACGSSGDSPGKTAKVPADGGTPDGSCDASAGIGLPPPDEGFLLGLAGVPQGTFGSSTAPSFAEPFASLASDGFNRFVPVFLTSESGEGTAEITYFLPPGVSGVPVSASCAGPSNPWLAAPPALGIVLPAYLLVLDVPVTEPLDASLVSGRMEAFVSTCLGGDASRIAGTYLYDEPANNYAASLADGDPANDFRLENVPALAKGARAVVSAPTLLVEAPFPLFAPYLGLPPALEEKFLSDWHVGVEATTPSADFYGFDFYTVDLTDDFSPSGQIVDDARAAAPAAEPIAVVQGFGYADMEIELPPATGRRPHAEEVRANAFMAVAHGARGVFWYGQSALSLADADLSVWDAMRATARDLRQLSGIFALPRLAVDAGNAVVSLRAHGSEDVSWVVAVNPTPETQAVHIAGEGEVTDALTGELVANGPVDRVLAPYEAVTFRRAACR